MASVLTRQQALATNASSDYIRRLLVVQKPNCAILIALVGLCWVPLFSACLFLHSHPGSATLSNLTTPKDELDSPVTHSIFVPPSHALPKLPYDVLVLVFQACVESHDGRDWSSAPGTSGVVSRFRALHPHSVQQGRNSEAEKCEACQSVCCPRWVHVAQVCQSWRATALSTPTLWSHLPLSACCLGHWERWPVGLHTSMGSAHPLRLHIDLQSTRDNAAYDALCANLHRAVELVYTSAADAYDHPAAGELLPVLRGLGLGPAPLLESLTVVDQPLCLLAGPLLQGPKGAPRLRHLRLLRSPPVSWKDLKPFLGQLTRLELHSIVEHLLEPSAANMLDALTHMSALQELSILNFKEELLGVSWPERHVHLAELRRLRMECSAATCFHLLSMFHYDRQRVRVEVVAYDSFDYEEEPPRWDLFEGIIACLPIASPTNASSHFSQLSLGKRQKLYFTTWVNFSTWHDHLLDPSGPSFSGPATPASYSLTWCTHQSLDKNLLFYFANKLPVQFASTACIHGGPSMKAMSDLLAMVPRALSLELRGLWASQGEHLLSALKGSTAGNLHVPQLKRIVIVDAGAPDDGAVGSSDAPHAGLSGLGKCISARRKRGCCISMVVRGSNCSFGAGEGDWARALGLRGLKLELEWLPFLS
ncbi:hypothetical protein CONPUDRAFT_144515 [Coniophora puteana RWD-64-598 SS2]|uniref:Uncharacterized protein n=1 Tax=Coniophora puteana (strain RWD-64-598) TaxID=741705 RepID=A0A5M3MMU2_CONPW|nr:uncharacterized protein CONPUDRAFT_144515 [Coniophora puteana RWD-64-598 SS2]EIW80423.1 hypothetical protein CONPUDRAFT_144515 [Coniophora puteana RWD-64-598 SS2]